MKHVVTAAPSRHTVLVTGFGAFPGAPRNPSVAILADLGARRKRLARLGIDLRRATLPVVFAALEPALRELVERHRPDAILHLGLASRRRHVSVEVRARNRAGVLHPDASGRPAALTLVQGGPPSLRATYPAARVAAAMRRGGCPAFVSRDAGDYVCNAALYRSLLGAAAPRVGFVHVPLPRGTLPLPRGTLPHARSRGTVVPGARTVARTPLAALTRAVVSAILVTATGAPARLGSRL